VTGSHLPGDIYARFHRLRGNHVVMVSGSDSHGTPVTIKATELDKPVHEVFEMYHSRFLELFMRLGIAYNLFTHTDTENHHQVAQDIFSNLLENEYLYREKSLQMYSVSADKFLPDRFVEGTCPNCGYTSARGDQCDNCNTLFTSAAELINPRSKLDDSELTLRETEHFFIDLPALAEAGLEAWLENDKDHWRKNVLSFSRSWVEEGLIGRAITRDMDWGIAIPESGYALPDHEKKVMYVWFEAVIGYLSATIEWAKNSGDPDAWRQFWYQPARTYYFIGKDNIPFHTVIWPAELLGLRGLYSDDPNAKLNLPYDVPANAFMNMEGFKVSGSRNWSVPMLEALERHDPDPLRYFLTAAMPETRDSDWSWEAYVERNNSELVANWGNLVNRVLKMTHRYFGGVVPDVGELRLEDSALLAEIDAGFDSVAVQYDSCNFRLAVQEILRLSTRVNQYLEEQSPWTTAKTDMDATAKTLFSALQAINGLKVLFAPVLPFTSQELHAMLGEEGQLFGDLVVRDFSEATRSHQALTYDDTNARGRWERTAIPAGRTLPKPEALFKKLDTAIVEDELRRLGKPPV
jgi:methionyl-tRNA synthetase